MESTGRRIIELPGLTAPCVKMWAVADIRFKMVDDMTDDPVVTVSVTTPTGWLTFAFEPRFAATP